MLGRYPYLDGFKISSSQDRDSVLGIIDRLSLENLMNRKIDQLSGGELQKVLFAQVLAQNPELLLLDEPTTHLDIGHQVEVMEMLKSLNSLGLTIISVLHDLNLASEYCSRLILLNEGKVVRDVLIGKESSNFRSNYIRFFEKPEIYLASSGLGSGRFRNDFMKTERTQGQGDFQYKQG